MDFASMIEPWQLQSVEFLVERDLIQATTTHNGASNLSECSSS